MLALGATYRLLRVDARSGLLSPDESEQGNMPGNIGVMPSRGLLTVPRVRARPIMPKTVEFEIESHFE